MDFETAFEKALEQVNTVKDLVSDSNEVTVCGQSFCIYPARGFPRACHIWSDRGGKYRLVSTAVVQNCRSFQEARERVAKKIAGVLCEPEESIKAKMAVKNSRELSWRGKSWYVEIIKKYGNLYCANMFINGERVHGLPEDVRYKDLRDEIRYKTGIQILPVSELFFVSLGDYRYHAYIDATQEREDCRVTADEIRAGWKPATVSGGAQ